MHYKYHRRPNRLPLVHTVVAKLRGRGVFSAESVSLATYFGQGIPHRQQRRRVRDMLDAYVQAGVLERHDGAACPLYRHREFLTPDQLDLEKMRGFEEHARSCRLRDKALVLQLIDHALDLLVPRDVDPARFLSDGSVITSVEPVVLGTCL